jgi:hypothetical protein
MKISKIILGSIFLGGMLTSCNNEKWFCTEGNGDIETKTLYLSSFSKVELEFDAKVYLSQGPQEVKIVASDNLLKYIEADVNGNELVLDVKNGKCLDEVNGEVMIFISNPTYSELEVCGSGDILNTTLLELSDLEINIKGSGSVVLNNISVDDYEIKISGSGEVELDGSNADDGEITISGSGDVDLSDLSTDNLEVRITGSGDAIVDVNNSLHVNISGSGDVKYSGSPNVNSNISGSGSVKKI